MQNHKLFENPNHAICIEEESWKRIDVMSMRAINMK
jgi:hypothetical protein